MIVVLKHGTPDDKRDQLIEWIKGQGLDVHMSIGKNQTILGMVGDTGSIDKDLIACLDIVDSVKTVTDPFKLCNRKFDNRIRKLDSTTVIVDSC